MEIEIEYCGMWNYLPEATRVAAELKEKLSLDPTLVEGSKGIFDVRVNGTVVYSKASTHKFPDRGEVVRLVNSVWRNASLAMKRISRWNSCRPLAGKAALHDKK